MGDGSFGRLTVLHKPLYQQVRELLLERIRAGAWPQREPLPSEQALADEIGVSVGTVRRAVEGLERQGIVRRRQGSGTYVLGQGQPDGGPFACPLQPVDPRRGKLDRQPLGMRTRRMSEAERRLLDVRFPGEVIEARTAILLSGRPVAYERAIVPVARLPVPFAAPTRIEDVRSSLSEHGFAAVRSIDTVGSSAPNTDAAVLGDCSGEQILECRRIALSADSRPLEEMSVLFRPSEVRYVGGIR